MAEKPLTLAKLALKSLIQPVRRDMPNLPRLLTVFLFAFLVSGGEGQLFAGESVVFSQTDGVLVTDKGRIPLKIEVAKTQAQRTQGLQFRSELAKDEGMLFVYNQDQHVTMWMKNTIISLDMLFMDHRGQIKTIAEKTEPLSLEFIPSGEKVRYVLELAAGSVQRLQIKPGDRLIHPEIGGK